MKTLKRYLAPAALLLLCALAFLPMRGARVRADEPSAVATVDGNEYTDPAKALAAWGSGSRLTLSEDLTAERTVTVAGTKVLELGGHSLALKEGEKGSVLDLRGGSLTVIGPGEIKGGDSEQGGGIYVGGKLTLEGGVTVADNLGSNLYLTPGNKIEAGNFTGRAGITMDGAGVFANGASGAFFADDLRYKAETAEEGWSLRLAPLAAVTASYVPSGEVYPTSDLESLRSCLTVTGTNENGVAYPEEIEYTLSAAGGKLTLGANEITVDAGGPTATFTVTVVRPTLLSLSASYAQSEKIYADTPLTALLAGLTVVGEYSDGISRTLFHENNNTPYEEDYIPERYTITGDLTKHKGSVAQVTVTAGGKTAEFSVTVSLYILDPEEFTVVPGYTVEGAKSVTAAVFVKDLPAGIRPVATVDGQPLDSSALSAGVYPVVLVFEVEDGAKYDAIPGSRETTLTVNRTSYEVTEGEEIRFSFTAEKGIAPEWSFSGKDVTGTAYYNIGGGYEARQVIEFTLFRGDSPQTVGAFTVRMLLDPDLRGKDNLKLYRVLSDGTFAETTAEIDGDYLVFTGSDFLETRYVVAADSNFGVYLALTIVFGVACAAGAGVLVWYFVSKRKMKLH